jgi:hypothetical protein
MRERRVQHVRRGWGVRDEDGETERRRDGEKKQLISLSLLLSVAPSCFTVHLRRRYIVFRRVPNPLAVAIGDLAFHFGRLAEGDAAGRNFGPFGHNAADGDNRSFADLRAVHHDGSHSDQAIVLDGRTVHDRPVTECDAIAKCARKTFVGVQDAAILHIRLPADANRLGVATNHRAEPDARFGADCHVANDDRAVGDEGSRVDELWAMANIHGMS